MKMSEKESRAEARAAFLRLLGQFRWKILVSFMFQLVKDSPVWAIPVVTAALIDAVVDGAEPSRVWVLVGLGLGVLAQNYPNHLIYVRIYSQVYRGVAATLRNQMAERLQQISIGSHSRIGVSVMQTKLVRDAENVELLLQASSPTIAVSFSILVGSISVTALQVPAFLLVYLLTVPLAVALVVGMRRRAFQRNEQFRREVELFGFSLGEMTSKNDLIRAHALEELASQRIATSADSVRKAGLALDRINGRFESASWVSFNSLSLICLGLAAWMSLTGLLPVSPGQVVLLGTYFAMLTGGVSSLVGLMPTIAKGMESMRSINELLRDPDIEENSGKPQFPEVEGVIAFRNVSFTYPDSPAPAVSDLNFTIRAGSTVAFVGPSGSGKSTIASLILGFVRPTLGEITIDGFVSSNMDLRSFRSQVSVVLQEPKLISASIRENLTFGLPERVSDATIRQALASARALDFVSNLPEGMDTIVGDRAVQLSGGQKQRIAIARALIRNPRVLILDEATSALDAESERAVQEALQELTQGRTCIIIAHRLSTIRHADEILVFNEGHLVESGSHSELVEGRGVYFKLYQNGTDL
jgi:ATP-binding cassette, subfamily B, bacterial